MGEISDHPVRYIGCVVVVVVFLGALVWAIGSGHDPEPRYTYVDVDGGVGEAELCVYSSEMVCRSGDSFVKVKEYSRK